MKNAIRQQNFRDRKKEQGKEVEEVKQVPVDERVHEGQQVRNMVKIKIKFVPLSGPISSVNSMMIIVMHQNDEADVGRERGLEVLPQGRNERRAQCVKKKKEMR